MKGSDFIFDCVKLLHYKFHKINLKCGGSSTDFISFINLFHLYTVDDKNTIKNTLISTNVALNTWLISVNF